MLAIILPSREREIPVATSGGTDSYCRTEAEISTLPRPSKSSLNASLRNSQSEISMSVTARGERAVDLSLP